MPLSTIGELAEKAQVMAVTIRYHEKSKLISKLNRSEDGHRQ